METPKVSVLIPTYNYAAYLPQAIESVLGQEFRDHELVIIDDASTDDSKAVLESWAARDPRIRLRVNARNLGMVQNWNECIAEARGTYLKFLFGDDRLADRQALGHMVTLLDAHASVSLVGSVRQIIDERSRAVDLVGYGGPGGIRHGSRVIADCLARRTNLIGEPSAVLFRKRDGMRGFDVRYRQLVDLEMWLHLLQQGDYCYIPKIYCAFRRHPRQQSSVHRRGRVHFAEQLWLMERYLVGQAASTRAARRALFQSVYQAGKRGGLDRETAVLVRALEARIGPRRWAHHLTYKVTRPFVNLKRSMLKHLPYHVKEYLLLRTRTVV